MKEEWKEIINSEGKYLISNYGRVKSLKNGRERILKTRKTHDGFLWYSLSFKGNVRTLRAHRLVAEYFIPNPDNKPTVNHIDGNKENNRVDNLEWATLKEQMKHAYENRLKKPVQGALQGNSLLSEEEVKEIRRVYKSHSKEFGMIPLAKKYNVSVSTINKCVGRRSYKNIK